MDSKLVIEQMAGRWRIKHPGLKPLAIQANSLAPDGVTWTWIPRELNREADRLVNEALDRASGRPVENAQDLVTSPAAESLNTLPGWDAELGKPTTLILLRHGSTLHTLAKRFSGSGGDDPGLNDAGKAQAGAAAGWLRGEGRIDAVISSPLRRTRETASIVAGSLGLDAELDDDIAEAAFGEWDGHTFAEVRAGWPEQLRAWLGSTDVSPPGGESFADVAVRVHRFRDRVLTERPAETVVVVSHVTPIKLLVRQALEAPLRAIYRMELRPASLSSSPVVRRRRRRPSSSLNDTQPLGGLLPIAEPSDRPADVVGPAVVRTARALIVGADARSCCGVRPHSRTSSGLPGDFAPRC